MKNYDIIQNFSDAPQAHTPAKFDRESCFWHATRRTQVVY